MYIFFILNQKRAVLVYENLRKAGFSKNRAKILALLEQKPDLSMADITLTLGISNSRASEGLKFLLREGYLQRMEVKYIIGRGRTKHIYRLKMKIDDIIADAKSRVAVIISYENNIDP